MGDSLPPGRGSGRGLEHSGLRTQHSELTSTQQKGLSIMAEAKTVTLDVRQMAPWDRHPKIFEILANLEVGDTLKLVNDHEPKPLYYQIMAERPGEMEWESNQVAPREWVALIKKVA